MHLNAGLPSYESVAFQEFLPLLRDCRAPTAWQSLFINCGY